MKTREVDLHGLRVREALSRLQKALRDMLLEDATKLRVIVGKGNHSVNKVPVLRMAVIKEMQKYVLLVTSGAQC
jgi:DNA-nicking Smr family endonuclease